MDKLETNWTWSNHIIEQIKERHISESAVISTISNPDHIVLGANNRKIYQKIIENKLLRVVTSENRLITAYLTSKINKYGEFKS